MSDFDGLISTAFKQLFTDAIDEVLSDTGLTVPCQLIYSGSKFTLCNNCWTENSMISTIGGYIPIKKVKVNDLIFDGNNYQKVLRTYSSLYSGDLYKLSCGSLNFSDYVTSNHKLPIVRNLRKKFTQSQLYNKNFILINPQIEEIEVKDINIGDAILLPSYKINFKDLEYIDTEFGKILIDDDLLYMIGWWIAEGCLNYCGKHTRSGSFCLCASKEESIADKLKYILFSKFGLVSKKEFRKDADNLLLNFHSAKLARFLLKFGHRAENKCIYDKLWNNLSHNQKIKILESYACGDGHIHNNTRSIVTISKNLALQIYEILLNNDSFPSISTNLSKKTGDGVNHKESYCVQWLINRKTNKSNIRRSNIGLLSEVKKIEKINKDVVVYNLEIENSHRYVVNNIISCNCTFNSMTGKSSGQYKTGGPIPFTAGICPRCHGVGRITDEQTETLYFGVIWDSKQFLGKFPIGNPNEFVQTISKKTSYDEIKRANRIIIDTGLTDYTKNKFERASEPAFVEFGSSSYIITTWKRTA